MSVTEDFFMKKHFIVWLFILYFSCGLCSAVSPGNYYYKRKYTKEYIWTLERLSRDKNVEVVSRVAQNPDCPKDLLLLFSESTDNLVRLGVALNTNASKELLHKLALNASYFSIAVASNPNCPKELFEEFHATGSLDILCAMASNPACPKELLLSLYENDNRRSA